MGNKKELELMKELLAEAEQKLENQKKDTDYWRNEWNECDDDCTDALEFVRLAMKSFGSYDLLQFLRDVKKSGKTQALIEKEAIEELFDDCFEDNDE